jgi:hypothetical protein
MTAFIDENGVLNTDGLVRLLTALRRPCDCEKGRPSEDCADVVDRWWIATLAGLARVA